jgi:hypothetical protein
MHLIELFLPLNDNEGHRFPSRQFEGVRKQLIGRFKGLTVFSRSPAEGLSTDNGKTIDDEIIVLEVLSDTLDVDWWKQYKTELERTFRQDEILIRATVVTVI